MFDGILARLSENPAIFIVLLGLLLLMPLRALWSGGVKDAAAKGSDTPASAPLHVVRAHPKAAIKSASSNTVFARQHKAPPKPHADGCQIQTTPLLNKEERALFADLSGLISSSQGRLHLFAQVSLDEIFKVSGGNDRKARFRLRATFSQKRVDFLIADSRMQPVLGIEYQGTGHHQGNYRKRDAAKTTTFDRSGLRLHSIDYGYRWMIEESSLRDILDLPRDARDQSAGARQSDNSGYAQALASSAMPAPPARFDPKQVERA